MWDWTMTPAPTRLSLITRIRTLFHDKKTQATIIAISHH
jgi:hypothetical protein